MSANVIDIPTPSLGSPPEIALPFSAVETYLVPLRRLLDGQVTEVVVNQPGEAWTESRNGWVRHEMPELTYDHLRMLAKLIATSTQQTISESAPVVSAALPSGERVQAIIPPAVRPGTVSLTIRKPSQLRLTLDDYERNGAFDEVAVIADSHGAVEKELLSLLNAHRIREFLEMAVRSKQNIVISGATGSGKTTIMKTLVDLIRASGEPETFPWVQVTHLVDARWAWLIGVGNDEWLVLPLRILSEDLRGKLAEELRSRTGHEFSPLP